VGGAAGCIHKCVLGEVMRPVGGIITVKLAASRLKMAGLIIKRVSYFYTWEFEERFYPHHGRPTCRDIRINGASKK
jgi:hypothetical protein